MVPWSYSLGHESLQLSCEIPTVALSRDCVSPPGWCVEYGCVTVRSALWISAIWWWQLHDPLQEDYSKKIFVFCVISEVKSAKLLYVISLLFLIFIFIFFGMSVLDREVNMTIPDGFLLVASSSSIKWCRYRNHSFPLLHPLSLKDNQLPCCFTR